MNRRDFFINMSVIGSAASVLASPSVFAASAPPPMAGGLYYTSAAPGRWAKKAAGHAPVVNVTKTPKGTSIKVITPHEMKGYEHYIVKHIVLDKDYQFIAETVFDPTKDKSPISEYNLGEYTGVVNVLSVCNLHDTWLSVVTV